MKKLFNEFEPVSESAWKQKIQADLKGADYNTTLLTTTPSGIHIKPIYHSNSAPQLDVPYRVTASGNWNIAQSIYVDQATIANQLAHNALERGSEGIIFIIPHAQINLQQLFHNLPNVGIQVHVQFMNADFMDQLQVVCPTAYVHFDILHHFASDGNWYDNQQPDFDYWVDFLKKYPGRFSNITVNSSLYQQAGATVVQELAYYMAHLNEYLNHLDYKEFAFAKAKKRININTTIGNQYFIEIAKYRTYRVLTKALGDQYDLDLEAYITATPSLRNKTLKDYNVNMLRTTTECMSAALGGADSIYNQPYDSFFNKSNEFGERIARNQLRILKDEAYFDKVNNPADGTYYINHLVSELTHKSLELFKNIEQGGGFIQQLFDGNLQRKIKESHQKELAAINSGERVLVGTTKYQDQQDLLKEHYDLYPFVKQQPRKTLIEPIIPVRIAQEIEKTEMSKN